MFKKLYFTCSICSGQGAIAVRMQCVSWVLFLLFVGFFLNSQVKGIRKAYDEVYNVRFRQDSTEFELVYHLK